MAHCLTQLFCCERRPFLHLVCNSRRTLTFTCSTSAKLQFLKPDEVNYSSKRNWHPKTNFTVFVPDRPRNKRPVKETVDLGLNVLRKGIPEWKQEWKDRIISDVRFIPEHGDYEYLANFNGPNSIKDWMVSCDSDTDVGKSTATLTVTPNNNTALFQGCLNTDLPKDGKSKNAGFCNLCSPLKKISFERQVPYDWSRYTHVILKVRGDGRNYMLNVQMNREYCHHWYDMYHFPLYTRGGPYWQITKIPFAKFYMAHSARIQDVQEHIDLECVKCFSITIMDGHRGKFQLEIDSIILVRDESEDNTFAYEMYHAPTIAIQ